MLVIRLAAAAQTDSDHSRLQEAAQQRRGIAVINAPGLARATQVVDVPACIGEGRELPQLRGRFEAAQCIDRAQAIARGIGTENGSPETADHAGLTVGLAHQTASSHAPWILDVSHFGIAVANAHARDPRQRQAVIGAHQASQAIATINA